MGKGFDYDLVVIGAGIAGFVSAVTANGLGKKVAVVEKRKLGGNCTSLTCIPSKALVRAGHVSRTIQRAWEYGVGASGFGTLDTQGIMPRVRSVVDRVYVKDLPETFEAIGIKVIFGQASFLDRHSLQVAGDIISSQAFIIATGTRPLIPKIPGLQEVPFLTNENLYELQSLPGSLLIMGGGTDGLEYACAFRNLGLEVKVVQRGRQLLPKQDREMVSLLARHMRERGIQLLLGSKPVSLSSNGDGVSLALEAQDGGLKEVQASALLVTVGREPDLEGLGLEKAGVKYSSQGILTDRTLRTSAPNIYACGDVVGPYQLASTAEYQGILAATNAFLPLKRKAKYEEMVFVFFTDPPLAYVGMTEEEARKRCGGDLKVYRFGYPGMRRAMVDGKEVGLGKFLCDARGKLVGVHILGEAAPEVIHEAQVLRTLGVPLRRLNTMTHAYPTYAQALVGRASQLAFLDHMERSFWVRMGLRLLPGLENRMAITRQRLAEQEDISGASPKEEVHFRSTGPSGEDVTWKTIQWGERVTLTVLPREMTEAYHLPASGGGGTSAWILLDFSSLEMMNGLGALALARLCVEASRRNQGILAVGVAEHHKGVLRLTGLDRKIRVRDTWEQAWAEIGWRPPDFVLERDRASVPRDRDLWARAVERFPASGFAEESMDLNVKGRRPCAVMAGFGSLWQKTYELKVHDLGLEPEELMGEFKGNFCRLQAPFNRFYAGPPGLEPGAVVVIHSQTPAGLVATGVMVLFADPLCFSLITPQGHPEAGWMTFRAFRREDTPVVQIVGFGRASDPFFEVAYRLMGSKVQVRTWTHVLAAFAEHLGVQADISIRQERVDPALQWANSWNIWHNAQIRTLLPWNMIRARRTWSRANPR